MSSKILQLKQILLVSVLILLMISCSKDEENPIDIENPDPFIAEFVEEVNADSIGKYIQWLEDMGTRFAFADNHRDVAIEIQNKFISFGYANTLLDSFELTDSYKGILYTQWQYNVVATIDGIINPDSICIIGGHYDNIANYVDPFTIAPGANDNASGVATTLEIARVISKREFVPSTTIKFIAFAAEELGLHGSYDYATKAKNSQLKIKMMLNNDMVGFWPINNTNWQVNIIDYYNSTDLRYSAQRMCDLYTKLNYANDNTYQAYSDSYSFAQNGFKAIFFISNADDHTYHTVNDLTSNCNFEFCREVAKVNCALLIENNGNY